MLHNEYFTNKRNPGCNEYGDTISGGGSGVPDFEKQLFRAHGKSKSSCSLVNASNGDFNENSIVLSCFWIVNIKSYICYRLDSDKNKNAFQGRIISTICSYHRSTYFISESTQAKFESSFLCRCFTF